MGQFTVNRCRAVLAQNMTASVEDPKAKSQPSASALAMKPLKLWARWEMASMTRIFH